MHTPVIFWVFDSNSGLPPAWLGRCNFPFDVMRATYLNDFHWKVARRSGPDEN